MVLGFPGLCSCQPSTFSCFVCSKCPAHHATGWHSTSPCMNNRCCKQQRTFVDSGDQKGDRGTRNQKQKTLTSIYEAFQDLLIHCVGNTGASLGSRPCIVRKVSVFIIVCPRQWDPGILPLVLQVSYSVANSQPLPFARKALAPSECVSVGFLSGLTPFSNAMCWPSI